VISSGLLCLYLAALVLFSHPLGFCASGIILAAWCYFARFIAYVFEPENLVVFDGREVEPDNSLEAQKVRIIQLATEIAKAPENPLPASRVLGASHEGAPPSSRVVQEHRPNPAREEQRENTEWADMFRSL
jgi:hypothetical protein